jgi:hypothetical protein
MEATKTKKMKRSRTRTEGGKFSYKRRNKRPEKSVKVPAEPPLLPCTLYDEMVYSFDGKWWWFAILRSKQWCFFGIEVESPVAFKFFEFADGSNMYSEKSCSGVRYGNQKIRKDFPMTVIPPALPWVKTPDEFTWLEEYFKNTHGTQLLSYHTLFFTELAPVD